MGLTNDLRRALSSIRRRAVLDALESRLVWIMGSPRSGSTWLVNLLAHDARVVKVDEPLAAAHLGVRADMLRVSASASFDSPLLYDEHSARHDYVFASRYAAAWRPPLRELLLERFAAQARFDAPDVRDPWVAIKEPHGSEAAPLIFSILPASRLLFLVRDGRDVVDSVLDMALAADEGSATEAKRKVVVAEAARAWVKRMDAVDAVFGALPDTQRLLLRYEDMRADPVEDLLGVYRWLGMDVDVERVRTVAGNLAFERIPAEARGPGRFQRAASPGLWRENLTSSEQEVVWDICGASLERFGYSA